MILNYFPPKDPFNTCFTPIIIWCLKSRKQRCSTCYRKLYTAIHIAIHSTTLHNLERNIYNKKKKRDISTAIPPKTSWTKIWKLAHAKSSIPTDFLNSFLHLTWMPHELLGIDLNLTLHVYIFVLQMFLFSFSGSGHFLAKSINFITFRLHFYLLSLSYVVFCMYVFSFILKLFVLLHTHMLMLSHSWTTHAFLACFSCFLRPYRQNSPL